MAITTIPNLGPDPFTVNASVLNGKVDPLATDYNGNIDDSNIATGAAIANAKLNLATVAQSVSMSGKDFTEAKSADIASATTTTIWATDGNYAHITGTTTITSFGTAQQAGDCRTIVFDGILTLTHNSTSLILPSAANITTAAGDRAIVRAETTANARVIAYTRADGTALISNTFTPSVSNALSGSVIQTVKTQTGAVTTGTTVMPNDDTVPQNGEGDQYLSLAITPNNSSNTLIIQVDVGAVSTSNGADIFTMALFQDSTAGALVATCDRTAAANAPIQMQLTHTMAAGTTSATTFKIRIGFSGAGTTTFNGAGGARLYGGVCGSSIIIQEIKA